MGASTSENRLMTPDELCLVRWMLENGMRPEAKKFLPQLESVQVTPWKCPCGCVSFDFANDFPWSEGMHVIADFIFGDEATLKGIFVFTRGGELAGVEVCGYAVDAPKKLPTPDELRVNLET